MKRRRRLLLSSSHLMEIDLLRSGKRLPMDKPLPLAPYFVFLSRAGKRPMTEVWPIPYNRALPNVPVPLLKGDADVTLDLQAAFTAVYDGLGYDLAFDYTRPPETPLPPKAAKWAAEQVAKPGSA